jgi:hypothetical protein
LEEWKIIADRLSKAGWSLGYVSAIDSQGRTIGIVDTHRDNGKRFVVHSDEKLTAFLELERATRGLARFENALLTKLSEFRPDSIFPIRRGFAFVSPTKRQSRHRAW